MEGGSGEGNKRVRSEMRRGRRLKLEMTKGINGRKKRGCMRVREDVEGC